MTVHKIADAFAQACADGELTIADLSYALEHMDALLADKFPGVALWMPQTFDETAAMLLNAEKCADVEEEETPRRYGYVRTVANVEGVALD